MMARAQADQPIGQDESSSAAQIQAYWTPARMASARAMPERLQPGAAASITAAPEREAGDMIIARSGRPGDRPTERVVKNAPQGEMIAPDFGPVNPVLFKFTRYRLFPNIDLVYKTFPWSTTGQLFFTIPGRGDFICSGSVVNSANKSVVWTAGHCVLDPSTGKFFKNFLFVPARHGFGPGAAPFGVWAGIRAFTTQGWRDGLLEFDHGAIVMNRGGTSNQLIGDAVDAVTYKQSSPADALAGVAQEITSAVERFRNDHPDWEGE